MLYASCSGVSGSVDGPLLVSSGSASGAQMTAIVRGEVSLEDGCLRLGGMPVIWPEGTSWNPSDEAVRLRREAHVDAGRIGHARTST